MTIISLAVDKQADIHKSRFMCRRIAFEDAWLKEGHGDWNLAERELQWGFRKVQSIQDVSWLDTY